MMTFKIVHELEDYCWRCQQLGEAKYGVKMHRNLPTQTWKVEGTDSEDPDPEVKWAVLCSDCLFEADKHEECEVFEPDGGPFNLAYKMLIRN
jgi:hypothetical protein